LSEILHFTDVYTYATYRISLLAAHIVNDMSTVTSVFSKLRSFILSYPQIRLSSQFLLGLPVSLGRFTWVFVGWSPDIYLVCHNHTAAGFLGRPQHAAPQKMLSSALLRTTKNSLIRTLVFTASRNRFDIRFYWISRRVVVYY